jgi:hypothetical protein
MHTSAAFSDIIRLSFRADSDDTIRFAPGDRVIVIWEAYDGEPARAEGPFTITSSHEGKVAIHGYPPSKWDDRTGSSMTGASRIVRHFP